MKARLKDFLAGSRGLNTVEVVIILAIIVGIALLFREQLGAFVTNLLDQIFKQNVNWNEIPTGTP